MATVPTPTVVFSKPDESKLSDELKKGDEKKRKEDYAAAIQKIEASPNFSPKEIVESKLCSGGENKSAITKFANKDVPFIWTNEMPDPNAPKKMTFVMEDGRHEEFNSFFVEPEDDATYYCYHLVVDTREADSNDPWPILDVAPFIIKISANPAKPLTTVFYPEKEPKKAPFVVDPSRELLMNDGEVRLVLKANEGRLMERGYKQFV